MSRKHTVEIDSINPYCIVCGDECDGESDIYCDACLSVISMEIDLAGDEAPTFYTSKEGKARPFYLSEQGVRRRNLLHSGVNEEEW